MSKTRNDAEVVVMDQTSEQSMAGSVFLFIAAIIYLLSPIDLIPDVPVIGYIDDLFVTATATLNLLQKWLQNTSTVLASMLGLFKWLVILTGVIAVSVGGMAVWVLVRSFMG